MAESTDKLICSICLNEFKQPKLIDCQHAFCLTCLEDYVNKVSTDNCFPCPLCCHYVSVPGGGVGEFPANLDIAERPVCKMEIPPCDVCKTGVISECRCQDCQQHLSNSCKTIHDSLRGCQDHVLVNMDDAIMDPSSDESDLHFKDVCPNHYEKEVRCYCKGCSLAVCSDCFVTSHSSHIFVDLHSDEIDAQTRRELKSLKEELGDHISEFEKYCESVEEVIADINNSAKTSCEAVDKQVDRICSVATEFGEEFKVQIETSRTDETQKLTKHLGEIKILIDELKASVKYSVDVLDDKSIVQVLNRIQTVEEEKEETQRKKLVMPDVKYTCFEEGVIDETILLKHLGTVEIQEESTFTSSFNLADLEHNKRRCIYGTDYHITGQGWYLGVEKK